MLMGFVKEQEAQNAPCLGRHELQGSMTRPKHKQEANFKTSARFKAVYQDMWLSELAREDLTSSRSGLVSTPEMAGSFLKGESRN